MIIGGITTLTLYNATFDQQKKRLLLDSQSQAQMIRFFFKTLRPKYSKTPNHPRLQEIPDFYHKLHPIGQVGEIQDGHTASMRGLSDPLVRNQAHQGQRDQTENSHGFPSIESHDSPSFRWLQPAA